MSPDAFLIVKLGAAGDALLATALARSLRRARPASRIAWLTLAYTAPVLEHNPDIDDLLVANEGSEAATALRLIAAARRWRGQWGGARLLLLHRARCLRGLMLMAGFRKGFSVDPTERSHPPRHRLAHQVALLGRLGIASEEADLVPRFVLTRSEREAGERAWSGAPRPRWVIAPGGAANPWSAMPRRRWAPERFREFAALARARGIALRWIGVEADRALARAGESDNLAGQLSLRHTAAVIAASDLLIGNDSLPLVLAHALGRPSLGLYGPTSGALIHAPGRANGGGFIQGLAGCGPCYDPRQGQRGRAYACPRARCMENISVEEVWRRATQDSAEVVHA